MPPKGANGVCHAAEDSTKDVDDRISASETQRLITSDPNNTSEGMGGDVSKARRTTLSLIKVLVFLDMFSVFLVVPLLSAYFRDLNISTELYGLMSSAYSLAQIVGGLVLATLSDRVISRRSVLLLSFVGSCVSYGMVGLSRSLSMLLLGRVVVGLVKQTMTMSTAIVTENTTTEDRSKEFSRLSAARTFAGIVGPSLGSFLYQRNTKLPPLVASSLFLLNTVLLLLFLPAGGRAVALRNNKKNGNKGKYGKVINGKPQIGDTNGQSAWNRFTSNFKGACRDSGTLRILFARLVYGFFMRSLAGQNFVGYFEERFGVESWVQGYVFSYRAGLGFLVELYAVGPILSRASETTVVWCALATVTLTNLAEATPTLIGLKAYLALVVPASVVANAALGSCLQSIFTQRVPQSDLGAALGTLDVLLAASGVVGPLYGAKIMGTLGVLRRPAVTSAHYAAFCALWWYMEVRRGVRRRKGEAVREGEDGLRRKVE